MCAYINFSRFAKPAKWHHLRDLHFADQQGRAILGFEWALHQDRKCQRNALFDWSRGRGSRWRSSKIRGQRRRTGGQETGWLVRCSRSLYREYATSEHPEEEISLICFQVATFQGTLNATKIASPNMSCRNFHKDLKRERENIKNEQGMKERKKVIKKINDRKELRDKWFLSENMWTNEIVKRSWRIPWCISLPRRTPSSFSAASSWSYHRRHRWLQFLLGMIVPEN